VIQNAPLFHFIHNATLNLRRH